MRSDIKAGGAYVELSVKDGATKGLRGAMRHLEAFSGAIGTLGRISAITVASVAGIGAGLALSLKPAVDAASDLSETSAKVGQIFGPDAARQIEAFAERADKALGQSKKSAMDGAATFATFGKAAGLTGGELVEFSTELTTLASDLASFGNTTPEEAIVALGAALRGESEPIRNYGVLLDDATLRQQALELGIVSTTKNALTPQQRVLAAHAAILKQTSDAQGDFARTSTGLANQQRILSAEFENLKAQIGEALLPVVTDITGKIVKLIELGSDWIESNGGIGASFETLVGQLGSMGKSIEDVSRIAGDTGEAIDSAFAVGDIEGAWAVAMLGMEISFIETLNKMLDAYAAWTKQLAPMLLEQLNPKKILERMPGFQFEKWLESKGLEPPAAPEGEQSGLFSGIGQFLDTSDLRQELARMQQDLEERRRTFEADPFNVNRNAPVKAPVLPPEATTPAAPEMNEAMRRNRSAPVLSFDLPEEGEEAWDKTGVVDEQARRTANIPNVGTFSAAAVAGGAFGSNPVLQELKSHMKEFKAMNKSLQAIEKKQGLKFA